MKRSEMFGWIEAAGFAALGGVGAYFGIKYANRPLGDKVKAGDVVTVPASAVQVSGSTTPAQLANLFGASALQVQINVGAVNLGLGAVTGSISGLPVLAPLSSITAISRNGKPVT